MRYAHLASKIFNTPLAIHAGKLDVILAVLSPRLGIDSPTVPASELEETDKRESYSQDGDVAVIDVAGTLVSRRPTGVEAQSGLTSYEEITQDIQRALNDPSVKGIMLRLHSPGGEVMGLDAMGNMIRAANKQKPVWASIDPCAFSAAYWIASAAERIYIPADGQAGSIGVIACHVDMSGLNEKAGLKYTEVTYGARKGDFSTNAPLSDEAYQRIVAEVNEYGNMFVDAVARGRGMAKKAVRDMEANTYIGQKAVDMGLANEVGSFSDAMTAMRESLAQGKRAAPVIYIPRSISEAEKRHAEHAGIERRDMASQDLRAESEGEPTISGHMAVFNDWADIGGVYMERIMPGAFAKTIQEADVHAYHNHNSDIVLGRVKSGTLVLAEDETGLHAQIHPPDTQTVRDLTLTPISRGDLDQGSIAFRAVAKRDEWARQDGMLTRTIHEVKLYHVSPVPRGAYSRTDVGLRQLAEASDVDYVSVHRAIIAQQHGLMTEEDRKILQQAIQAFTRCLAVAPGMTHPTGQTAEPPIDMETLRVRLRLMTMRAVR